MARASTWTPERDADLTALAHAGGSTADAARRFGITREGVRKRALALGVRFTAKPGERAGARPPRPPRPRRNRKLAPDSAPVAMLEAGPCVCRWPIANDWSRDQIVCGAPTAHKRTSYCVKHHRRAYITRAAPYVRLDSIDLAPDHDDAADLATLGETLGVQYADPYSGDVCND